ncbi:hypothetical protein F5883DRAFT_417488 [Diaporthe sp. PMI_573]|nr:hypothetical protein F5883DRAFT_417488 [Diaporthaceae sp. PMI_573]
MEVFFDTSVPWYIHEPPQLQPEFRELVTKYANIQPQEVDKHIQAVRDKAWRLAPFPCVGSYLFAELALFKHPPYPKILNRIKSDPSSIYLEVGCGLAQDIRKLIADGAPAASLRGTDLQAGLMACGHDLFRDAEALPLSCVGGDGAQDSIKSTFVAADFLDESGASPLKAWEGGADFVHASMFLHCFELPTQVRACKRIVALLRAQPGSLLVGRSGGGPLGRVGGVKRANYLHDVESFKAMWDQVGKETGTKWEVKVVEEEIGHAAGRYFAGEEHRWLRFEVSRL